jgi:hypothetical protein
LSLLEPCRRAHPLRTGPREMEYAWCKALAYGAAMSLETNRAVLDANGRTGEILATIKNWEELKLAGYFPERIKEQLREPGREFALEQAAKGAWQVRPVAYGPEHYVARLDGEHDAWTFENTHPAQPLRASVRVRPQLAEYGDASNVALLSPGPLNLCTTGAGPLGRPRQGVPADERLKFERGPVAAANTNASRAIVRVPRHERRSGYFQPSDQLAGWDSRPLAIADFRGTLT